VGNKDFSWPVLAGAVLVGNYDQGLRQSLVRSLLFQNTTPSMFWSLELCLLAIADVRRTGEIIKLIYRQSLESYNN